MAATPESAASTTPAKKSNFFKGVLVSLYGPEREECGDVFADSVPGKVTDGQKYFCCLVIRPFMCAAIAAFAMCFTMIGTTTEYYAILEEKGSTQTMFANFGLFEYSQYISKVGAEGTVDRMSTMFVNNQRMDTGGYVRNICEQEPFKTTGDEFCHDINASAAFGFLAIFCGIVGFIGQFNKKYAVAGNFLAAFCLMIAVGVFRNNVMPKLDDSFSRAGAGGLGDVEFKTGMSQILHIFALTLFIFNTFLSCYTQDEPPMPVFQDKGGKIVRVDSAIIRERDAATSATKDTKAE